MAFIEVTRQFAKRKAVLNVDHIVRYGASYEGNVTIGSVVYLSTPVGTDGLPSGVRITEKPEELEELLQLAGVGVYRAQP